MSLKLLRKEIKADFRKQHDLYVNNWVGDVKANPKDFTVILEKNRTISKSKKLENELVRTSNETCYFKSMQYFNIRYKILPTPFQYNSSYRLLNVVRYG